MKLPDVVTLALVLFIYVMVALCATWAWTRQQWVLAVLLTIIFIAASFGVLTYFESYGT